MAHGAGVGGVDCCVRLDRLVAAAKVDMLSLSAFEVGLFGWMALTAFVFFPAPHHIHPDTPVYWFLMQVGMVIGFITACRSTPG